MAMLHIILRNFALVDLLLFGEEIHRELLLVRVWGLEPQRITAREPKSRMSANSIIPAWALILTRQADLVNFASR